MKYRFKNGQLVSYLNNRKKRITGKVIECFMFPDVRDLFFKWQFKITPSPMYTLKLKNGHISYICHNDTSLIIEYDGKKEEREKKLNRILKQRE